MQMKTVIQQLWTESDLHGNRFGNSYLLGMKKGFQ